MNVAFFSTKPFEHLFLAEANREPAHSLTLLDARLTEETAPLAAGHQAVAIFANDHAGAAVLRILHQGGTRLLALRSAGFNHVDLAAAAELGLRVVRVPAYSPYSVAEHAVALILALNRKTHRAFNRVREGNFVLDGLMGFDLHGKSVGVVGTGKIGAAFAAIMKGFGCRVIATDLYPSDELRASGIDYVDLEQLLASCQIISLHAPLTPQTRHMIDGAAIGRMQPGVMLINTSRGGLIDTRAAIAGLKSGKLGYLGIDVYEEEADLFFKDLSEEVIHDDVFMRLLTFPNVIVTGHQGFFTREAVSNIERTTIENITAFARGEQLVNEVSYATHVVQT
jgi:D-lactate dehydrogenase